jgi:hypothetical protein
MRRVLLALAVVVIGLPVGGWLVLRRQAAALGATLVADARRAEDTRFTRPGRDGNELDCLGRHADLAPDSSRVVPWTHPTVLGAREGSLPPSVLPQPMLDFLHTHEPWLDSLVDCARFGTVAPTDGFGPTADAQHPRRQLLPRLDDAVMALMPLHLREVTLAGRADDATRACTSTLQLLLDVYRLEGLEGLLGALATTRSLVPACAAAADAASDESRARYAADVTRLRSELPPFSRVMQLERLQLSLRLFGPWLPGDVDAQLPPGARAITAAARATSGGRGVVPTAALRLYWRRFDAAMQRCVDVADLPEPARTPALVDAMRGFESPTLHRFFTSEPADLRYQLYAQEADQLRVMLELLALAAAVDAAPETPTPPGFTRIEHEGLVTLTPTMPELSMLSVTVRPGGAVALPR